MCISINRKDLSVSNDIIIERCKFAKLSFESEALSFTVPSHHRMLPDEYDDKSKQAQRSRSPARGSRDRSEHSESRKIPGEGLTYNLCPSSDHFYVSCCYSHFLKMYSASKEERPDVQDLLADLQDISDVERKTSTAESSIGNVELHLTVTIKV